MGMADLTVPVLRFRSPGDCERAVAVLTDQRFAIRLESDTEISFTPREDLGEARDLLDAEGIACALGEKPVTRLGPRMPAPRPG